MARTKPTRGGCEGVADRMPTQAWAWHPAPWGPSPDPETTATSARDGYRVSSAGRRSRTEARRTNHWQGAGVGCEDVVTGGRLRSGRSGRVATAVVPLKPVLIDLILALRRRGDCGTTSGTRLSWAATSIATVCSWSCGNAAGRWSWLSGRSTRTSMAPSSSSVIGTMSRPRSRRGFITRRGDACPRVQTHDLAACPRSGSLARGECPL